MIKVDEKMSSNNRKEYSLSFSNETMYCMFCRAPEVAERQKRQSRRKTTPHIFPVVPSTGNDGNSDS